jgi:NAD(P)-dependent dehydrogenase (short-subunit alcohol dehydrogenase family)
MGYFDGRMLQFFSKEKIESTKNSISLKRFGKSDEVISAINFAISNEYINGGFIDIDGGIICD